MKSLHFLLGLCIFALVFLRLVANRLSHLLVPVAAKDL